MNFELQDYILLFITCLAIVCMSFGVYKDIKDRKFPNTIILTIIGIGVVYSLYAGHFFQSITGFLLVNICGIFFHAFHIMSSGDMKYLSTLFLFISISHIPTCLLLIAYLFLAGAFIGFIFYKKQNKNMLDELKKEMISYKALLLKINMFTVPKESDYSSKEEMLQKTMPFSLPIYLAFVLTYITMVIYAMVTGGVMLW